MPLTREEVVVQKDAHVTGAVRLHKTEGVETQQVSETVRKEDVEVVRDGKTVTEDRHPQKVSGKGVRPLSPDRHKIYGRLGLIPRACRFFFVSGLRPGKGMRGYSLRYWKPVKRTLPFPLAPRVGRKHSYSFNSLWLKPDTSMSAARLCQWSPSSLAESSTRLR